MTGASAKPRDDNPSPLIEPLTERELDVLRLLVKRLSNAEIAHEITLSVGTVKWYIKQIYGKLAVHSRAEAAARALELSLLNGGATAVIMPAFLLPDSSAGGSARAVFVGRERELNQLDRFLQQAIRGQGQVVFVTGEAGRGKTTLLTEFAQRAQNAHAHLLIASGNCNAFSGIGDPYLPFRDVLDMLCGNVEPKWAAGTITRDQARCLWEALPQVLQAVIEDGPDLVDVFVSAAILRQRLSAAVPDPIESARLSEALDRRSGPQRALEQLQLFEQYTAVLQRLMVRHPLILLLDDLQWADEASLSLLFHLGRRLSSQRVLIIGAYRLSDVALHAPNPEPSRPPSLSSIVSEFKRRFGDIQIDLASTDPFEDRRFVDALLDSESNQLSESFRATLFERTKGHPLFMVELLRDMQERGHLIRDDTGCWIEGAALKWDTLPARVEAVIGHRMSRLNQELRGLLTVASVEGEDFTAEVLSRIQQRDERAVLHQLSEELGQHHRLVRERGEVVIGQQYLSCYRFGHILFQQYLYQQLSAGERRVLHRQVAHALEALYADRAEDIAAPLARHFIEAGDRDRAAHYLRQAGDQALRSAALVEAARYYQSAVDHWPATDTTGRAGVLRKLGESLWMIGWPRQALDVFQVAYDLFEALGDRQEAGAMQRFIGRMHWELSDRAASLKHYHQALAILETLPESVELARTVEAIGRMYAFASDYDPAITWSERALAMARRLEAEDVIVTVTNTIGGCYTDLGDVERGLSMYHESLQRALALGLPVDIMRAYDNMGDDLMAQARYREAREAHQSCALYAEKVQALQRRHQAQDRLSLIDWLTGNWRPALAQFMPRREQLLGKEQVVVSFYGGMWPGTVAGLMYNDLGHPQAARQLLEKWLPQARQAAELQTTAPHLGELFRASIALKMDNEALSLLQEFLSMFDAAPYFYVSGIKTLPIACHWLADGDAAGHAETIQTCIRLLEKGARQFRTPETAACLHEALGSVRLAEGKAQEASEHFRETDVQWLKIDRVYDRIRALNGLSRALVEMGDSDDAGTACDQATQIVERLSAQLDDEEMKMSFLKSALVREIEERRRSV